MKRSQLVQFVLLGIIGTAAVILFLRPRTDPRPVDASVAPPMDYRLVWAFDPPSRAVAPVGFDARQFGPLILVAVAHSVEGRARGAVYALDRNTGQPRWTFDADRTLSPTSVGPSGVSSLFVADGPGKGHRLFALRDADGSVRWEMATADQVTSPPGAAGDLHQAAVPAGDDGVYLVDERNGKVLWHFDSGHVNTRPCGEGGRLFVVTGASEKFPASELLALNAETGGAEWRVPLPETPAAGDMWVGHGVVIVPLTAGLACFDSKSGARKWLLPEGGPPALEPRLLKLTGPLGTQMLAFVGTREGLVRAVDVGAGQVVWSVTFGSPVVGSPSQSGEYVFAVTRDGQLFQLDQRTGAGIGRFDATTLLGGNPTVLAGVVGPRAVLIAEADTAVGRSVRVVCLEHVKWFTPR